MKDRQRMSEILQRHGAELMALDARMLIQARVQRARAVALTQTLLKSYEAIEADLDGELSAARAAERRGQIERLHELSLAYFAADLAREESAAGDVGRRAKLAESVAEHDHFLLKWAWPLFGDDAELAEVLLDIQRGRGQQDSAEDVLRLVELFRDRWSLIEGQTPVDAGRLDRAEADATELVTLLNAGEQDGARDLARRAYSAWHHTYRELMLLGRYLMRNSEGAEAAFPNIHPGRRPIRREVEQPAPDGNAPEPDDDAPEPPIDAPVDTGPELSGPVAVATP